MELASQARETFSASDVAPARSNPAAAFFNPDETSTAPRITRLLVADGNPTVRKILKHIGECMQWETIEAEDGEQALAAARARPAPDAIILDLQLAKVNGYEVCRRLKTDERSQLIPIVVITSAENPDERLRALEVGADDFLTKPINRAELTVRIRALLRIHKFNQELIGAESVALALARAVAAKDGYSKAHVEEVANYAVMLGKALDLEAAELSTIRYGAILHNVGKIAIPDAVLEKTGELTPREKALFQQYPRISCDICAPLKPLKQIVPIVRHHKENWNGTGYPDGLRGAEIPLGAQIVGLVNNYCAMTSDRPFRKAVSQADALARLRERAARGLHDPALVEKFVACLEAKP